MSNPCAYCAEAPSEGKCVGACSACCECGRDISHLIKPASDVDPQPLVLEHDPDAGCVGCVFEAHYLTHGDKGALVVAIECSAGIRWERPWGEDRHPAPPECPLRSGPVTVRRPGSGGVP